MRRYTAIVLALCLSAAAAHAQSGDVRYGETFTVEEITPLAKIIESPDEYVGKEVRTAGYVYTMCDDAGCWLGVLPSVDAEHIVKVAYSHTDVRFPVGEETTGHYVELQGEVVTVEQEAEAHAEHMEAEGGAHEHGEEGEHVEAAAKMRTIYACPMHPDVASASSGTCSICKMDLEAKEVAMPHTSRIAILGVGAVVKARM